MTKIDTDLLNGNVAIRPLTAQEEIYWQLTYTDQIHPVLAAHLDGVASIGQWRSALDTLQQRHPMLTVSIETPDTLTGTFTQHFFLRHARSEIPLRIVLGESVSRWEAEIEKELSLPFKSGQAPLIRAVLIQKSTTSIFMLSASHSICDGMSLSFLMLDLLSHIAGAVLEPLDFPLSAEELLGVAPAAPVEPAINTDISSDLPSGIPTVESLEFDEVLTKAIIDASRKNGTTVHGALAAALALAMYKLDTRFIHEPVRIISPVNVRSLLGADRECGMYFTSPKTILRPQTHSFWDMARETRQNVSDALSADYLMAVTAGMQQMTSPGLTKTAAADALSTVFAIDMLLTNLGQTPYGSIFGNLKLESLWPAVLAGSEVQTVGVTTTNGKLCLLLTSRKPIKHLLMSAQKILSDLCADNSAG